MRALRLTRYTNASVILLFFFVLFYKKNVPMWPAQYRATRAVAPRSVEELRPARGVVALRVTMPGCTECARFEVEGRAAYEEALRRDKGVTHIHDWSCKRASYRRVALDAGVEDLPSYLLVPARGEVRVERPDSV